MLTLALDSTANTAACALALDGRLLAEYTADGLLTHSETLLPMIEHMLKTSNKAAADVDLFACVRGPGSFTGVRIGVSLIKGLAFGSDKPCIGVSAMDSLAANLRGFEGLIVPVMDARRSQVYTAIFDGTETDTWEQPKRLCEDLILPLAELRKRLLDTAHGRPIFFVGDGYSLAHRFFEDEDGLCIRPTPASLIPHKAFPAALLAWETFTAASASERAAFTDSALSAGYLRPSQAERERLERLDNDNTKDMEKSSK